MYVTNWVWIRNEQISCLFLHKSYLSCFGQIHLQLDSEILPTSRIWDFYLKQKSFKIKEMKNKESVEKQKIFLQVYPSQ